MRWILFVFFVFGSGNLWASCTSTDVSDAELRLTNIEKLYTNGIRTKKDVERAKSQILELKFCANQIHLSDYCRQRSQSVSQSIDKARNGNGVHRKPWLLELGSTLSQLCKRGAQLVALSSPSMVKCNAADVAKAQSDLTRVQSQFKKGFATIYDVHFSEDSVLETNLCAGKIVLKSFCSEKMKALGMRLERVNGKKFAEKHSILNEISDTYLRCHEALAGEPQSLNICPQSLMIEAQEQMAKARDMRTKGLATNKFVSQTRLAVLNTQLCTKSVSVESYCNFEIPRTVIPARYDFRSKDNVGRDFFMQKVLCFPHRKIEQQMVEAESKTTI